MYWRVVMLTSERSLRRREEEINNADMVAKVPAEMLGHP